MPPFAIPGRRRRARLQGLVDRWVGVNQRSAGRRQQQQAGQAQTAVLPSSSHISKKKPTHTSKHLPMPSPSPARPIKRASYAGHELSVSDLVCAHDESNGGGYNCEHSIMYDSDKDSETAAGSCYDQGTLCTEQTGELTQRTGCSFFDEASKKMSSSSTDEQDSSLEKKKTAHAPNDMPLPMPQLHRRVSAPPILGLTVETPSPTTTSKAVVASLSNGADNDNILLSSEDSSIVSVPVDDDEDGQAHRTGTSSAPVTESTAAASEAVAAPNEAAVMPQQDTPPPPRLRFNPKTKVYHHLHLDDYADDEFEASFHTDQDMRRIQVDAVESVHKMRAHAANAHAALDVHDAHQDIDAEVCSRGLENMLSAAVAEAHRTAWAAVRDAVLDEQDLQFMGDIYDEERLAATSAAASADSVMEAILRGASDAVYVQRFVRAEDDGDGDEEYEEVEVEEDEEDEVETNNNDQSQQDEEDATASTTATNDEAPPPAAAANGMESLSSILQEALDVSMQGDVEALEDASSAGTNDDIAPRPNPSSLSRIGSRERLLNVLGELRSDMAQARMEFQEVSHIVRRDSRRSSASDEASQSSA